MNPHNLGQALSGIVLLWAIAVTGVTLLIDSLRGAARSFD